MYCSWLFRLVTVLLYATGCYCSSISESPYQDYQESLTFERLANGDLFYVMTFKNIFNATTTTPTGYLNTNSTSSTQNYSSANWMDLFPLSLFYLVQYYHVEQFEFSLTHGAWQGYQWGVPSQKNCVKPSGSLLFTLFQQTGTTSSDSM